MFGARSDLLDVSLSPSGNKVDFIMAGPEHTEIVSVVDLAGDAQFRTVLSNGEKIGDIDRCEWASDERLVCQLSGMADDAGVLVPFDRLLAVNADGSNVKLLSQRNSSRAMGYSQSGGDIIALDVEGETGMVLMTHNYVPESTNGTRIASTKMGLGVDLLDTATGRTRIRE